MRHLAVWSPSRGIMTPIFEQDFRTRLRCVRRPGHGNTKARRGLNPIRRLLVPIVAQGVREPNEALKQTRRARLGKFEARRKSGLNAHFCC
jgi:hypothetical protein